MPLTFAHPLAVVPLRRLGLPLSALAVGSMIPDVVLFAPWLPVSYGQTHSPVGLVTIDVVLGLVAWLVWERVLRRPLADAAPAGVRHRLPAYGPASSPWWTVPVALVVGAITHVLWDAFTHPGRWGTRLVPWLSETHAGMLGAKWAQYASGLVGVLGLALLAGLALWRVRPRAVPRRRPRLAPWVLLAPALVGLAVAGLLAARGNPSIHDLAYDAVTRGGAVAAVTLLVCSVAWHVAPAPTRTAGPAPRP